MKRPLLRSSAFVRAAQKVVRKHSQNAIELQSALELLEVDALHPRLRTHKLKEELKDSWACSGGYDLRIVLDSSRTKDLKRFSWNLSARMTRSIECLTKRLPGDVGNDPFLHHPAPPANFRRAELWINPWRSSAIKSSTAMCSARGLSQAANSQGSSSHRTSGRAPRCSGSISSRLSSSSIRGY